MHRASHCSRPGLRPSPLGRHKNGRCLRWRGLTGWSRLQSLCGARHVSKADWEGAARCAVFGFLAPARLLRNSCWLSNGLAWRAVLALCRRCLGHFGNVCLGLCAACMADAPTACLLLSSIALHRRDRRLCRANARFSRHCAPWLALDDLPCRLRPQQPCLACSGCVGSMLRASIATGSPRRLALHFAPACGLPVHTLLEGLTLAWERHPLPFHSAAICCCALACLPGCALDLAARGGWRPLLALAIWSCPDG